MHIKEFLPSGRFTTIVGSVALSVGLIFAAQALTAPKTTPSPGVSSADAQATYDAVQQADWQATLAAIQAQNGGGTGQITSSAPDTKSLLNAAETDNVTNAVARRLLINLSDAKSQGLGDDIPTQDKLIADANARIKNQRLAPTYTTGDLTLVPATADSLHTYGDAVMTVLGNHPKANFNDTLLAVGNTVDTHDAKQLGPLTTIGKEYAAIAKELTQVPVPSTLSPLHLSVVNNYAAMASTYADMGMIVADPLRGLAGLQMYQLLVSETVRVFTTIAGELGKNAILFNTSEPGASWSSLLTQKQP